MMYAKDNADFKFRRLRAVQEDFNSGATTLARKALEDMIDFADCCEVEAVAELITELDDLATQLSSARPSRVAVGNALSRWQTCLAVLPQDDLSLAREEAQRAAEEVIDELEASRDAAVAECLHALEDGMTIMTLSSSTSVMALFNAAYQAGIRLEAIITESRPSMEGRKLARFLNKLAIPTQFISEAQMASFVPQADKVILGADSLLRDGALISKAGSRLLALAARDAGVPFWVLAEGYKHSLKNAEDVQLEEMPEDEMQLEALTHVRVRNIYFDLVPARLVTAWVNEQGVRVEFQSLAERVRQPLLGHDGK